MQISVNRVIRILAVITLTLASLHVILMVLNYVFNWEFYFNFAKIFHLNAEQSIPAYFSTILLFIASCLLWVIGGLSKSDNSKWKLLALIFLLMSVDEMASLHEKFIPVMRDLIGENQVFYWGWTIPGILFLIAFAFIFFKFWTKLPRSTKTGMMWAGLIFVSGALLLEFAESIYFYQIRTYRDVWLDLLFLVEETMEMAGMIIFINTLLLHLKDHISLKDTDIKLIGKVS